MKLLKLAVTAAILLLSGRVFAAMTVNSSAPAPDPQLMSKRILVVYYSRTGNTRKVAEGIARAINADIEEIIDKKPRGGAGGYMKGGRDASKESLTEIAPLINDPSKYDLIIIGTPVWAWNMAPAVRTYITANKAAFKEVAFFTTSGGTKPAKIVQKMESLAGLKAKTYTGFFAGELKESKRAVYDKKLSDLIGSLK